MPHLIIRVIENKETGKGCIEILEQKSIICKPRVGLIAYHTQADKKQLIDSLLDGGKNGQLVQ